MPQAATRTPRSANVVVGYDGSETAGRALVRAAEIAGAGGHVFVVTAVPGGPAALDADPESRLEAPGALLEEAAARLDGYGVDVSTQIDEGDPVDALVGAARETGAQLIVVGARGESYVARALRGSVGERLVARAPCDLLIAR